MTYEQQASKRANKNFGAAEAASNDWFKRQCADLYASMYLYYKPGTIAFWIAEDPLNEDWRLADTQRIQASLTKEQVCRRVCDIAKSLPILGEED